MSENLQRLRESYNALRKQGLDLLGQADRIHQAIQDQCDHLLLVETPYIASPLGTSYRRRRICTDCGLEEEGWNDSEFQKLRDGQVTQVLRREAFYKLRGLDFPLEPLPPILLEDQASP